MLPTSYDQSLNLVLELDRLPVVKASDEYVNAEYKDWKRSLPGHRGIFKHLVDDQVSDTLVRHLVGMAGIGGIQPKIKIQSQE